MLLSQPLSSAAQALLNLFREPQAYFLQVQSFLDDRSQDSSVLLSDLAEAFERVNPHWIMHVLISRHASYWVLVYCRHILFGRKVLHKVGSHFRPPLPLRSGVDMGRAFSVLLFCVAMDPWYHHVNTIPRVLINKGYMDDNATGGLGLSWLLPTQILIQKFSDVLSHSCYLIKPLSSVTSTLPLIESCTPVIAGFSSLFCSLPRYSSFTLCTASKRHMCHHNTPLLDFKLYRLCDPFPPKPAATPPFFPLRLFLQNLPYS